MLVISVNGHAPLLLWLSCSLPGLSAQPSGTSTTESVENAMNWGSLSSSFLLSLYTYCSDYTTWDDQVRRKSTRQISNFSNNLKYNTKREEIIICSLKFSEHMLCFISTEDAMFNIVSQSLELGSRVVLKNGIFLCRFTVEGSSDMSLNPLYSTILKVICTLS